MDNKNKRFYFEIFKTFSILLMTYGFFWNLNNTTKIKGLISITIGIITLYISYKLFD